MTSSPALLAFSVAADSSFCVGATVFASLAALIWYYAKSQHDLAEVARRRAGSDAAGWLGRARGVECSARRIVLRQTVHWTVYVGTIVYCVGWTLLGGLGTATYIQWGAAMILCAVSPFSRFELSVERVGTLWHVGGKGKLGGVRVFNRTIRAQRITFHVTAEETDADAPPCHRMVASDEDARVRSVIMPRQVPGLSPLLYPDTLRAFCEFLNEWTAERTLAEGSENGRE